MPSSDKLVGWGSPDGYVYQKAYVEFFCSPGLLEKLMIAFERYVKDVDVHIEYDGPSKMLCTHPEYMNRIFVIAYRFIYK